MNSSCKRVLVPMVASIALLMGSAHAQEPRQSGSVEYISGGVGAEERARLDAVQGRYNLHLTLALSGGAYVNDVRVRMTPASHGEGGLQAVSEGPLFMAKLPPGDYLLTANYGGKEQSRKVNVPAQGAAKVSLYWNDEGASSSR